MDAANFYLAFMESKTVTCVELPYSEGRSTYFIHCDIQTMYFGNE